MHHGNDIPPEIQALNDELMKKWQGVAKDMEGEIMQSEAERFSLGATGRFPEGKIADNDEGEIQFGVARYKGKILINFEKPVAYVGMNIQQAKALISTLRRSIKDIEREARQRT
jgi:hypothetical protein